MLVYPHSVLAFDAPSTRMPLQVTTFCTYRTTRKRPWSDRDYAASKFIKALKERPVNGWAYVPVGKEHVRLDAANAADAPDIFARQATCGVKWDELGALTLVPIPNSSCAINSPDPPRTLKMANALARRIESAEAIVADPLRWREVMSAAHVAGGTRDPVHLFARLRLREAIRPDRRVVLIDDVIATGGHMRAAAAFLESQGAAIAGAICAGRADDCPSIVDAFAVHTDTLETFVMPPIRAEI